MGQEINATSLENRPGIFLIGSSSIGKRTLLSQVSEYGITETEGRCLLGSEEPAWEIKRLCTEWCSEHNIE
ncbi:conserved hypothetical protein [Ricinus communis]|uniref:Uncharacterized protein n=1 Tax=Ricinus communis TaxID=3988 RepID=B9SLG0_RICCO|nr:conserved hypothetical protein [Ricinus communis]